MAPVHALIKRDPKAASALEGLRQLAEEEKRQREQAQRARKAPGLMGVRPFLSVVGPDLNLFVPPYDYSAAPSFFDLIGRELRTS